MAELPKEYEVKAAFLYNFAKFVTWPDTAFASPEAPLVVGVLGKDPFGPILDNTLKAKKIGVREIIIERYASIAGIRSPHVLFVANSELANLADIVDACKGKPILLVGDMEDFAQKGGVVNFYIEKANVRFAINIETAKKAQLQISSQLLKLAKVLP
jgi:YfiR/HmsC-like